MIVNNTLVRLGGMHKAEIGDAVNLARKAAGEVKDCANCRVRENAGIGTSGVGNMGGDIVGGLAMVKGRDVAAEVNALRDGFVDLFFEDVADIGLRREDEGHGAAGVHVEIKQEADLSEHLHVAQVRLVDDDDRQFLVVAEGLEFFYQLTFGVAAIEVGPDAKLVQEVEVEVARGKVGLRNIKGHRTARIQAGDEMADGGGLSGSRIAGHDEEIVVFHAMGEPVLQGHELRRHIQGVRGYVPLERGFGKVKEGFKHHCHPRPNRTAVCRQHSSACSRSPGHRRPGAGSARFPWRFSAQVLCP